MCMVTSAVCGLLNLIGRRNRRLGRRVDKVVMIAIGFCDEEFGNRCVDGRRKVPGIVYVVVVGRDAHILWTVSSAATLIINVI